MTSPGRLASARCTATLTKSGEGRDLETVSLKVWLLEGGVTLAGMGASGSICDGSSMWRPALRPSRIRCGSQGYICLGPPLTTCSHAGNPGLWLIEASSELSARPQLELVQSSLKYFLELRQHSKSDTLEWVSLLPPCC